MKPASWVLAVLAPAVALVCATGVADPPHLATVLGHAREVQANSFSKARAMRIFKEALAKTGVDGVGAKKAAEDKEIVKTVAASEKAAAEKDAEEKAAAKKAAAEKAAAEKAAAEKAAAEKAAAEKAAAEKAAAEKAAAEAAAAKKAAAEKAAAEKATAEKVTAEKAVAKKAVEPNVETIEERLSDVVDAVSDVRKKIHDGMINNQPGSPHYDHLRLSVVRIQAVSSQFDWFKPFVPGYDGVGTGSGFIVQTTPYPLIVTNHHVVSDAKQVSLQLLLYGHRQWEAEVVSVCPKFDLALVVLKNSAEFMEAMKKQKIEIEALQLSENVAAMGEDVVALGFPLGQDALKISKGNIAGNEEVNGNICIQSTAPISPGNSGGPLLNSDGSQVVGVNFAKATAGENINYVIPAWRVSQMVKKHLEDQPEQPKDGFKRVHVQVPYPELTTIESNEALYTLDGGCDRGVYTSKIGTRSFFRKATPAMQEGSFLISVNGAEIDRFGMGQNSKYAADRVHFTDLFFMVPNIASDVEFETCVQGKIVKHKTSMQWLQEYDRGLQWVYEPNKANLARSYEMFGDISVMQMTKNHIGTLVHSYGMPGPARWLHPDFVDKPRLIINWVRSGSYAARTLSAGAAVSKVNGKEVFTLEDFRKNFNPKEGEKVWTIETDMGKVAAVMFEEALNNQLRQADRENAPYLLTPGVVTAAKALKLSSLSAIAKFGEEPLGSPMHSGANMAPLALTAQQQAVKSAAKKQNFLAQDKVAETTIASLPLRASGPLLVLPGSPGGQRGRVTQDAAEAVIDVAV